MTDNFFKYSLDLVVSGLTAGALISAYYEHEYQQKIEKICAEALGKGVELKSCEEK